MPAAAPRGLRSTNTSRNVELVDVFSSTLATDWWLYTPTDSLRQASLSRATKQLMPTPRGRRFPHTQGGGSGLSYHVFRGAMTGPILDGFKAEDDRLDQWILKCGMAADV